MSYNAEKLTKLSHLKALAEKVNAEYAKKVELATLSQKVDGLIAGGGEPNVLEGIKVNGSLLTLTDKIADILIAESTANGKLKVNNVDVAVHGLAALAYKAQVAESDLATALKNSINAKAKQSDLDTLTGEGEGSISKMITDAINDFATKVSDDGVVNSYKELIDWVSAHGAEAAEITGDIEENSTAINNLKTLIGTLPEGATATTVVGYIAEAIEALAIGDYAKTTEVTAAINASLANYYTKNQIDGMKATDAEVTEMLAEVFA